MSDERKYSQSEVDKMMVERLEREKTNNGNNNALAAAEASKKIAEDKLAEMEKIQQDASFEKYIKDNKLDLTEDKIQKLKEASNSNVDVLKSIMEITGVANIDQKESELYDKEIKVQETGSEEPKQTLSKEEVKKRVAKMKQMTGAF